MRNGLFGLPSTAFDTRGASNQIIMAITIVVIDVSANEMKNENKSMLVLVRFGIAERNRHARKRQRKIFWIFFYRWIWIFPDAFDSTYMRTSINVRYLSDFDDSAE